MRKLVTVETVTAIKPIPDADRIEAVKVRGWEVVTDKGRYRAGDRCLYFEIDSFLPITADSFAVKHGLDTLLLRGKKPKTMMVNGKEIQGIVLKTIKLKGQISQGFLQDIGPFADTAIGTDISEQLGVLKYEAPMPAQLQGLIKGNFPFFITKTDEERIQNIPDALIRWNINTMAVTEKLEGTSATFYKWQGEFGVCSRNLELEETENNIYWQIARREHFAEINEGFAIQGEIIGEGIQSNPYKIHGNDFFVFAVWDITHQCYLPPEQWGLTGVKFNRVPIIDLTNTRLSQLEDLLTIATGPSALNTNTPREGLVFKTYQPYGSFKVISNEYLLKNT